MSCDTFIETLRSEIRDLPKYESGLSLEYVRAHYRVDEIAKLGSNENPFGASPQVVAAIAIGVGSGSLSRSEFRRSTRGAVPASAISPDRIALGNGSEDLIAIAAIPSWPPGLTY